MLDSVGHLQNGGVGRHSRHLVQLEEHATDGWTEAETPGRASNFRVSRNEAHHHHSDHY